MILLWITLAVILLMDVLQGSLHPSTLALLMIVWTTQYGLPLYEQGRQRRKQIIDRQRRQGMIIRSRQLYAWLNR